MSHEPTLGLHAPRRPALRALLPWLLLAVLAGCESESAPTDSGSPSDAPLDATHPHDAGDADAGTVDAGTMSDAGGARDAGPVVDAGPVSADCLAYCECFERDCAGIQGVPTGESCFAFCATFTHEQWDCRISHCRLVVPESNPSHCMHAAGIDQCL